ncbi:DUF4307 domain-containing protein [Ornithinimicrobium cerasi]|uniref:DUF4307 domain-containing protein n=1 Tax=Ornithinimicrobium cerasi TaxID=2248773 RepID=UPI00137B1692|nr:DUF4307 domain-containing protein [Ornithinimicrobium cerasi]
MTTPPPPHEPLRTGPPAPRADQEPWTTEEDEDGWRASRPEGHRRLWWWVGGLGVTVMVALAVWFGVAATAGRVHWVFTGHDVVSATQVDVRFDLRRDPARAVVCELEAQDGSHTVVGRTEVEVGPTASSPSRHIGSVQTATEAVTGYVDSCRYADEAPPAGR